jgi:ABC-type multidrug transport system fused ATPase/permease subunit
MLLFVYAVLVFLVLRFSVTLFNFLSNPKLGYYGKHFTEQVSVIVLTSTTGDDVEELLFSVKNQDYQYTEVIVQNGESITELVKRATGRYLLFTSSSVTLQNGLINSLIYRTKVFNLAVLSLIPTYKAFRFIEKCLYPLSDFLLLNLLPLRLIRLSGLPAFAAGNSDCLFFDAATYKRYNWHERLNGKFPEAIEIIKMVKQQQLKAEVLLANKFIYHHINLKDMAGFSRSLLQNFSDSNLAMLMYLTLVVVGPVVVVLFSLNPALAVLLLGLIFLTRVMIAFLTAQSPIVNVLLHPIQMAMLFMLLLRGGWERMKESIKRKK